MPRSRRRIQSVILDFKPTPKIGDDLAVWYGNAKFLFILKFLAKIKKSVPGFSKPTCNRVILTFKYEPVDHVTSLIGLRSQVFHTWKALHQVLGVQARPDWAVEENPHQARYGQMHGLWLIWVFNHSWSKWQDSYSWSGGRLCQYNFKINCILHLHVRCSRQAPSWNRSWHCPCLSCCVFRVHCWSSIPTWTSF